VTKLPTIITGIADLLTTPTATNGDDAARLASLLTLSRTWILGHLPLRRDSVRCCPQARAMTTWCAKRGPTAGRTRKIEQVSVTHVRSSVGVTESCTK